MRRRALVAAGAVIALVVGALTLVVSGGATGSSAKHCSRLWAQSTARERMVTGQGQPVVVIGDSYSVGLGLRAPATSWPSRLPGRIHVFGFSGSGFSAHSSPCPGVAYAARALRALHSASGVVVVEGGLNDYDQPVSAIRTGFRALIGELRGNDVLVVGPPPAPVRAAGARRVDAVLRDEAARSGVPYLSMIHERLGYLPDRLHLTPAGHTAFGDLVARALAR